ncbi:MAG: LytR/AlgR family response regulator transcription factor [Saprospiraceae bacterium]
MSNQSDKQTLSSFSILIVEDELSFAIELDMLIQEIGYQVKGRVDNSTEALEIILMDPPDLVLMDIHIKGRQTGLEVAEGIVDKEVPILFITGIEEQEIYQRAKATNFVGYLVKPVNKFSICAAIELALKNISRTRTPQLEMAEVDTYASKNILYFKKKGVFYKIPIKDILYIQANGDQTITYTSTQKYTSFLSLNALMNILTDYNFVKVHRSYLANIAMATAIDVDNGEIQFQVVKIPFSRRMKKDLLNRLPIV